MPTEIIEESGKAIVNGLSGNNEVNIVKPKNAYFLYSREGSRDDSDICSPIEKDLAENGLRMFREGYRPGESIDSYINRVGVEIDVFIVFLSYELIENVQTKKLATKIKAFVDKHPEKMFLPIYGPHVLARTIPSDLSDVFYIQLPGVPASQDELSAFSYQILKTIKEFFERKNIRLKDAKEIQAKIESTAAVHLNPISKELKEREISLERSANIWFIVGYISMLAALAAPFIIKYYSGDWSLNNYPVLIYYSVKSVVFVVLSISLSKYASNLAKSYMNESRKVADRRHAISFGEFALKVSTEPIQTPELKEIFKEWNIIGNSSFMPGTAEDHDPKLLEKVKDIILAVRGKA